MLLTNDGWLVTRGVRAGQRGSSGSGKNTHTHNQVTAHFRHKYTQLSGADEDHSQNTQPQPRLPWVSLTPFLPHAHTPSSHTHTQSCREAACCPCGLWRIITQQCRLKSQEWTSSLSALASSSPWHRPPHNRVQTVAGCCSVCFLRNVYCVNKDDS